MSVDTNREIKCAREDEGWTYKAFPVESLSRTGHVDFEPRDAGIEELWKPWMTVTTRGGQELFLSSAYYGVLNPIRVYNDGSLVPRRDVDGDGQVDLWIPTLEACQALVAAGAKLRHVRRPAAVPRGPRAGAAVARCGEPV